MNNENPMTTNQSFIKKIFTKRGGSDSSSKTKTIIRGWGLLYGLLWLGIR